MLFFLLILSINFLFHAAQADSASDSLGSLKNMWDGASKFVTGMGESFGYVPDDYVYSFRFFNDSAQAIAFASQDVTKILGAGFQGRVTDWKAYAPFQNSGEYFAKKKFYFILWMLKDVSSSSLNEYKTMVKDYSIKGAEYGFGVGSVIGALIASAKTSQELQEASIYQRSISIPDDKNWYYYRAYTDKGSVKGEYLGIKTTTSDFTGVFYNSSTATDVFLQFIKDGTTYKVALEPKTFSLLSSSKDVANSIRPPDQQNRAFTFYQGQNTLAAIPVASEGICNMQYDEKTKKLTPGSPMVYTYEIFSGKNKLQVGIQGLAVGNYDQPVGVDVIRDLNPTECHVWYQSPQQAQAADKSPSSGQIYAPYQEQMWLFYKTKDYVYQQKITSGQVIDYKLLRPRISEKNAQFYVAALDTTDDTKALQFLNRLADKAIGEKLNAAVTASQNFDEKTVLTSIQSSSIGIIDDTKGAGNSGVKGYILLTDTFNPRGVGSGPFYYSIKPLVVYVDQLADALSGFLDPKKFDSVTTMNETSLKKVIDWTQRYTQQKSQVEGEINSYIMQYGAADMFENKDRKNLNSQSKSALQDFITGTVSMQNMPSLKQAGSNLYVYNLGTKPDNWPQ